MSSLGFFHANARAPDPAALTPPPPPAIAGPLRGGHDPRLEAFLRAPTPAEADRHLVFLIQEVATPVIFRALRGRRTPAGPDPARDRSGEHLPLAGGEAGEDEQEIASATREALTRRLRGMQRQPPPAGGHAEIRDFAAYVAAVTGNARCDHLRRKYPARVMVVNRLRYLLENRSGQTGFALWADSAGERWCGFAAWRQSPTPVARFERLALLRDAPREAADRAWAASRRDADADDANPAARLAALFRWLGGPVELAALAAAMGHVLGFSDVTVPLETVGDPPMEGAADGAWGDAQPSPRDALGWKQALVWLWGEIRRLPGRQRLAFALHSEVLVELDALGVASVRELAAGLELPAERLAAWWGSLPLDDRAIAEHLGGEPATTRQQVINLRRVARDSLGRAWERSLKRDDADAEKHS